MGCGKSTVVERLRPLTFLTAAEEPVGRWADFAGVDLLSRLYASKTWASPADRAVAGGEFQLAAAATLAERYGNLGGRVVVAERSLRSSREVFLPATDCSPQLRLACSMLCQQLERQLERRAVRIHLKCDREELLRRVRNRNRPEERGQEYYLADLADRMDRWCESNCRYTIDTTRLDEDQVAAAVVRLVKLESAKSLCLLVAPWLALLLLLLLLLPPLVV